MRVTELPSSQLPGPIGIDAAGISETLRESRLARLLCKWQPAAPLRASLSPGGHCCMLGSPTISQVRGKCSLPPRLRKWAACAAGHDADSMLVQAA